MNPTERYDSILHPHSEASSEDSLHNGQLILDDNMTLDTISPPTSYHTITSSETITPYTSPGSARSDTSPGSATTKTSYAREHAKYMKKRLSNVSILAKVKERLERYLLERQILDIKIKECKEYIGESEKVIEERNSILHPPTQPSPPL
jgi:hypothetical protein